MKMLAILTFMLGIFATSAYAQQKGTVTFNGNVFDGPSSQTSGYAQPPTYGQPPAKAKTYGHVSHVRRHIQHKSSAS
jgi:type 1 fimbria pilin